MPSEQLTSKLLRMKEKIEEAKTKTAQYEGELKSLFKRLKEEFGCGDLESAKRLLTKMEKDLEKKERTLAEGVSKLEQEYDWN